MIYRFNLFLCLCFYSATLNAQIRTEPPPLWSTVLDVNDKFSPDVKNISGGYYVILQAYQDHIPSKTLNVQRAVRAFNTAGVESISDVEITFDPGYQKLVFHRLSIIRNGKFSDQHGLLSISFANLEERSDERIYDGRQTASIHLKDVRINDIIYLHYSIIGQNPVFENHYGGEYWLYAGDSIDRLHVSVISPLPDSLHYKLFNTANQPSVYIRHNMQYHTWDLYNLSPVKHEYYPSWFNPYPMVSLSSFSSWDEVRQWVEPLFQNSGPPSNELQEWLNNIKDQYPSLTDQITAVTRWVQNEVRYLGLEFHINSHKPADPNKTFINRYGDCKDKSFLLHTMLEYLGVESYPILINTYAKHQLNDYLPSAYSFNHCVLGVSLDSASIYIDPTINYQGGKINDLYFPDYTYGLAVHPSASGLQKLVTHNHSSITMHEIFRVPFKTGGGTLSVITEYKGHAADYQRAEFQYQAVSEIQKSYVEYYEHLYDEVKSIEDLAFSDDSIQNIFTVEETYFIGHLWIPTDSTIQGSPLNLFVKGSLLPDYLPSIPSEDYKGPLEISHPFNLEHKITVHLPEKWNFKLQGITLSNEVLDFSSEYHLEQDSIIQAKYKMISTGPYLKENEIKRFRKFREDIENEIGITITAGDESDITIGFMISVLLAFLVLVGFSIACYYLYYWNPLSRLGDEYYPRIGGWLILPSIGIFTFPILLLLASMNVPVFENEYWKILEDEKSKGYFGITTLFFIESILTFGLLCLSVLQIILFLQKRTSFPKLMVVMYAGTMIITVLHLYSEQTLLNEGIPTENQIRDNIRDVIASISHMLIWGSYFLLSERVAGTFVKRLKGTDPPAIKEIQTDLVTGD